MKHLEGKVARGTVYAVAAGDVQRVDLETLSGLLGGLSDLTGQPVTPNDLLEVIEEPIQPDNEDAWLEASATDLKAMLEDVEKNEKPHDISNWQAKFAQVAQ